MGADTLLPPVGRMLYRNTGDSGDVWWPCLALLEWSARLSRGVPWMLKSKTEQKAQGEGDGVSL